MRTFEFPNMNEAAAAIVELSKVADVEWTLINMGRAPDGAFRPQIEVSDGNAACLWHVLREFAIPYEEVFDYPGDPDEYSEH
jgi:hypothetical protein